MKYCTKCKVNVHHQLNNCPLCGSYLDSCYDNDNCAIYKDIDNVVVYPVLTEKSQTPFFKSKFNLLLILSLALCIAINLTITPSSNWSAYVAIGVAFVLLCVMLPICAKTKFVNQLLFDTLVMSLLAVAMELFVTKWHFAWISCEFVLPWFSVAGIAVLDFLIIFNRKRNRKLFSSLIAETLFAMSLQITFWIASVFDVVPKTNICLSVFFASIANLLLIAIMFSKYAHDELERTFNV